MTPSASRSQRGGGFETHKRSRSGGSRHRNDFHLKGTLSLASFRGLHPFHIEVVVCMCVVCAPSPRPPRCAAGKRVEVHASGHAKNFNEAPVQKFGTQAERPVQFYCWNGLDKHAGPQVCCSETSHMNE